MIDVLSDQLRKKITNNDKKQLIQQVDDVKNKYYNYRNTYHSNFNEISYNNKQLIKKTINKKINNEDLTNELNQSNVNIDESSSDDSDIIDSSCDFNDIQPLKMTNNNKYKLYYK